MSNVTSILTGMPPELIEMIKLMNGGKMPPNMDMKAFEELALSLGANPHLNQPQSPSTKSTSSSSSNHEQAASRTNSRDNSNKSRDQAGHRKPETSSSSNRDG